MYFMTFYTLDGVLKVDFFFPRISAVIYTGFRFIGDFSTQDQKPGVLTKFLTGTDAAT